MTDYPYIQVKKNADTMWPWRAMVVKGPYDNSYGSLEIGFTRAGAIRGCRRKWKRLQDNQATERVEL